MENHPGDAIEQFLKGITIPETGLVLRATWDTPTGYLSAADRTRLVHLTDDATGNDICGSTDWAGHWADVVRVSHTYWVTRHVDEVADTDEYRVFASFDDAYSHYEQVVRGQQDATAGKAWRECDVPGVLAGEDLRAAERAGYSYEEAAPQYAEDRDAALDAWAMLDALRSPTP